MTVCFVVSAYRRPRLLRRLVERLDGRACAVHVDAKVDVAPFHLALSGLNVTWLPRHLCRWGGFGHVQASLEGLRWFDQTGADHVMLLTGQCYPVRPVGQFERWLDDLGPRSLLNFDAFPHPRWMNGGWDRVQRTHVHALGRTWHLNLAKRRMPLGHHPYGGSSYWCLSRHAARYILDVVAKHPEVVAFYQHVWIPDEIFFQTLLCNSELRATLINDDVHHIEWVEHQPSPRVIRDPQPALHSGKWFARKFDDEDVLDQIDTALPAAAAPASAGHAILDGVELK